MVDIARKVIAVSGATGNLGAACVTAGLAAGARIAALGRSKAALERQFPDAASDPHILLLDGVDLEEVWSVDAALARTVDRFGGLDAVMNTVGGFAMGRIAGDSFDTWSAMQAINVQTAFTLTRAAIPLLQQRGGGSIVHVAALAGLASAPGLSAYAASKAAVLRLVEAAAAEHRSDCIRVNAVMPGTIDTPQNREAMPDADVSKWVSPAAIADAMLMLAGDHARAVTGAAIPVTGPG